MNNLSGEGLFDERPMTLTSLGRFVLGPTELPFALRADRRQRKRSKKTQS
jgi:hypothetical protein